MTRKDYLGHDCKFTEAKGRFADPLCKAKQLKHREIKRQVGKLLLNLSERIDHTHNASLVIRDVARSVEDDDQIVALMEMLTDYEATTSNIFFEFAGLVIAGFEDTAGAEK